MNNSAIIKIVRAKEQAEVMTFSDEYEDMVGNVMKADDEIEKKLEAHPELLELYNKVRKIFDTMHFAGNREYYKKGFQDGLLVGIETLFDN